jgi:signal transduction histidine kinase
MTHPMDETRAARPDDVSLVRGYRLQQAARVTPVAEILDDPFLREALHDLVLLMEQQVPDMIGSVLLLDADGVTLHHGAAPHLPEEYCRLIDGSRVGPVAGSCGTAAYRGAQVIVRDIATDPLWAEYKRFALPHGLAACWSTPIREGTGPVLGTFAMYYKESREPHEAEQALIRIATTLSAHIIIRAQTVAALRRNEAEMRQARAEAERANNVKSEFLSMMSHELRTPLNAIGGYAKLMLDGIPEPVTSGQQEYLRRIMRAQGHLLGLIEAVLTRSKLDAGRMTYRMENIRIGELLDVVESLSRPQLTEKEISYDCDGCDSKLVLRGDRQKVVQILVNLLSNAIKFTPSRGRITLRTFVPAFGRVEIGVRDTGVGMNAEQAATVFEPFVQFDNSLTRQNKGTGLGMSISRDLARGMGGDLTVQSEPGTGTEFLLTLAADSAPPVG